MAKSTVPVNFKDDIMNSAMNGKRRYRMINNSDGTISLEDVTTYDQVGSNFGAAQMNATNKAVNAAADASKIIDDIDAIRATTQSGYMAGALALKQVDDSLVDFKNMTAEIIYSGTPNLPNEVEYTLLNSSTYLDEYKVIVIEIIGTPQFLDVGFIKYKHSLGKATNVIVSRIGYNDADDYVPFTVSVFCKTDKITAYLINSKYKSNIVKIEIYGFK